MPTLKTRKITTRRITWRGVSIRVRYTHKDQTGHRWNGYDPRHKIELFVARDDCLRCPVIRDGYADTTVSGTRLRAAGGPWAYVRTWLETAARDPYWIKRLADQRRRDLKARQLDLFTGHPEPCQPTS